jgi:hypothetical protein
MRMYHSFSPTEHSWENIMNEDPGRMSGGSMYHDSGFAGLRVQDHPKAGLLNKEQNIAGTRQDEVSDVIDQPVRLGPRSITGSLLLK